METKKHCTKCDNPLVTLPRSMEEIKKNVLYDFDNHFNNSEVYLQKHCVYNKDSISCGEDVKNKLICYLDTMIDAHKKELNSGRKMYQQGREDMKKEILEIINNESIASIKYGSTKYCYLYDDLISKIK